MLPIMGISGNSHGFTFTVFVFLFTQDWFSFLFLLEWIVGYAAPKVAVES